MTNTILIPADGGEIIGDSPERRVEVLSDHETLNATCSRFGPHREGADLHVHQHHTDLFYVLEGELTVRLGVEDRAVTVPAGTLARVPPLVVHGFRNASDADFRFLNFHAPGRRFTDYLRAMRDGREFLYDQHEPPTNGGRSPSQAVVGGAEVLGDGVSLLADVEELGIAEARLEPRAASPPLHLHRRHTESFYVLEGELTFTAGGHSLQATPGSFVQVPPDVAHTFAVAGDEPTRFLNMHSPSCGFGDFLRALHTARDEDELATARAAFDQEPV